MMKFHCKAISLKTGGGLLYVLSIKEDTTTLTELNAMAAPATSLTE
jgi:hypothetical protein